MAVIVFVMTSAMGNAAIHELDVEGSTK